MAVMTLSSMSRTIYIPLEAPLLLGSQLVVHLYCSCSCQEYCFVVVFTMNEIG